MEDQDKFHLFFDEDARMFNDRVGYFFKKVFSIIPSPHPRLVDMFLMSKEELGWYYGYEQNPHAHILLNGKPDHHDWFIRLSNEKQVYSVFRNGTRITHRGPDLTEEPMNGNEMLSVFNSLPALFKQLQQDDLFKSGVERFIEARERAKLL